MTRELELSQGQVALLDDADFEWASQWKWCASRIRHSFYALRTAGQKQLLLHRALLAPEAGVLVDHINGNGLDKRRHYTTGHATKELAAEATEALRLRLHSTFASSSRRIT